MRLVDRAQKLRRTRGLDQMNLVLGGERILFDLRGVAEFTSGGVQCARSLEIVVGGIIDLSTYHAEAGLMQPRETRLHT